MNTYPLEFKRSEKQIVQFSNGVKVLNVCNHDVTFQDGEELISVSPGYLVNAKFEEELVSDEGNVTFVQVKYTPEKESEKFVKWFKSKHPDVLICGSMIAAQAFPEEVVVMTPVPGFERVRDGQKRKSIEKFTTFAKANRLVS